MSRNCKASALLLSMKEDVFPCFIHGCNEALRIVSRIINSLWVNKIISAMPLWVGLALVQINGLPKWLSGKDFACQCRRQGFDPCVGKIRWRRAWQPTPVFLPGESQGQGSLVDYNPWGHKESDTAEQLSMHACNTDQRVKSQNPLYFCFFLSLCLFFFLSLSSPVSQ